MNKLSLQDYYCPVFIFDPEQRQGQLFNPATGSVVLEFPQQTEDCGSFPLHEDSRLSIGFASYLYYLVYKHLLFTHPADADLVAIEVEEEKEEEKQTEEDDDGLFEYATVWLRPPLEFPGLADFYDGLGFCFIDGALFNTLYCDVIEGPLAEPKHSSRPPPLEPQPLRAIGSSVTGSKGYGKQKPQNPSQSSRLTTAEYRDIVEARLARTKAWLYPLELFTRVMFAASLAILAYGYITG